MADVVGHIPGFVIRHACRFPVAAELYPAGLTAAAWLMRCRWRRKGRYFRHYPKVYGENYSSGGFRQHSRRRDDTIAYFTCLQCGAQHTEDET